MIIWPVFVIALLVWIWGFWKIGRSTRGSTGVRHLLLVTVVPSVALGLWVGISVNGFKMIAQDMGIKTTVETRSPAPFSPRTKSGYEVQMLPVEYVTYIYRDGKELEMFSSSRFESIFILEEGEPRIERMVNEHLWVLGPDDWRGYLFTHREFRSLSKEKWVWRFPPGTAVVD